MRPEPHWIAALTAGQEFSTVVDRTAKVEGHFTSVEPCAIRIDGRFTGSIRAANGLVVVSETGVAEGVNIEAAVVVIAGFLNGRAHAHTMLHISHSADVSGRLCYSANLQIQPKATVRASLEARTAFEK